MYKRQLEDGSILRDGIDMTPTEYYAHLASCRKLPTTSQPSPEPVSYTHLDVYKRQYPSYDNRPFLFAQEDTFAKSEQRAIL